MSSQFFCLIDNHLIQADDTMDNRAFAYGDGFFSTMGVYQGRIFFADGHLARLRTGAKRFCFDIDCHAIYTHLQELASSINQGIIKLIVSRKAQAVRGYGFVNQEADIYIKTSLMSLYDDVHFSYGVPFRVAGSTICLSEVLGIRPPRLAGLKLIGASEQIFAHQELLVHQSKNPNIAEGLVKNTQGLWISGTMSNVFYRLNGQMYTPIICESGVAGVAREALINKLGASERPLSDSDLPNLESLYFCNAVRGISAICTLHHNNQTYALSS